MVLISNVISKAKYNLGLGKTGLNSEVVLILGGLNRDVLLYRQFRLSPICTPLPLETLLFLLFACRISSNFVLEHFKITLQKMASVVLMLNEQSCTWYWEQQYVADSHNLGWKSRLTSISPD